MLHSTPFAAPYVAAKDHATPQTCERPSTRPWHNMLARLIAYQTVNVPFSIGAFCFLFVSVSVAVCLVPFCGIGAILLIHCADMVDLFARWDLALSNFVSQPADQVCVRSLLEDQPRESLTFELGEMLCNMAVALDRLDWNAVVYFLTVKFVLAIAGVAILVFAFVKPVVDAIVDIAYFEDATTDVLVAISFTALGIVGVVLLSLVCAQSAFHFCRHYIVATSPSPVQVVQPFYENVNNDIV